MKQLYMLLFCGASFFDVGAQTAIYARFTNYSSQVLKTDGTTGSDGLITATSIDPSNPEFFKLTTFTENVEQTLNIGSQSTGAGAGKITFNPVAFSRPVDGISPLLLSVAASGTAFRTVEIFFVDASNSITVKQLYKLAAVKTIAWSGASCSADCPAVIENLTLQYGGLIDFVYKAGGKPLAAPVIKGWNMVSNVADNDPNAIIR